MEEYTQSKAISLYDYIHKIAAPRGVTPKGLADPQSFKEVSTHQNVCRSLAIKKGMTAEQVTELIGGCKIKNRNAMGALR